MSDVKVTSDPHSARAATSTLRREVEVVKSPWSLAGCSGCGLRDRARPAKSTPVYGGEPDGIGPFCGKDAVKIALWSVQSGSQQCVWKRIHTLVMGITVSSPVRKWGANRKRSVTFQVAPHKPGINVKRKFARIVQMSLAFCTPMTTKITCCQSWTVFASTNGMIVVVKPLRALVKASPHVLNGFWGSSGFRR